MQKQIKFLGDSLKKLIGLPAEARQPIGYQLHRVQEGKEPKNWKPMPSIGAGVREIRVKVKSGAFRAIYVAKLEDTIYVLHVFQKKTQKTAKPDIDLAKQRYNELTRKRE